MYVNCHVRTNTVTSSRFPLHFVHFLVSATLTRFRVKDKLFHTSTARHRRNFDFRNLVNAEHFDKIVSQYVRGQRFFMKNIHVHEDLIDSVEFLIYNVDYMRAQPNEQL